MSLKSNTYTPDYKRLAKDLLENIYGHANASYIEPLAKRISRYAFYGNCYAIRIGEEGHDFEINSYTRKLMIDCKEEVKEIRAEIRAKRN